MISASPVDVSIVSAVYNVARYLPGFLDSLEAQQAIDLARIEIIAVDDGSTDDSLSVLRDREQTTPLRLTVLTKPNGGQGSARNLGIRHASGEWITFPDPDDTFTPEYFAKVLSFVTAHPEAEMLGTNRLVDFEATGEIKDSHPLRHLFTEDRVVNLDLEPMYFQGAAPSTFVRRSRLLETGVRFDETIRPNFEDGHFCSAYLLTCTEPLVGFVSSAKYLYRRRADGSGAMQSSFMNPDRYTTVPRQGYLDVLRRGVERYGRAPEWLQNFILYELSWLFSQEVTTSGAATAAVGVVGEEFRGLLKEILGSIHPQVIESFQVRRLPAALEPVWRQILLHGVHGEPWHSPCAVIERVDAQQGLAMVTHRFVGPEPEVVYASGGHGVRPTHTKLRSHVFFGAPLLRERIAWLPVDAALRVQVDGRLLEMRSEWPTPTTTALEPLPRKKTTNQSLLRIAVEEPDRLLAAASRRAVKRLAATPAARRKYAKAWVLMDRIDNADDSAEHLFVYLRENRPNVNAWFTVEAGTPDYVRLKAGRHGDRVVAHGSRSWQMVMLNADHLISSHIDNGIVRPPTIIQALKPGNPKWKFTFLQHGVIKDDLSRWLNRKAVDLFITSTPGEYASIVDDGSTYSYTGKEVKLTGLPRFDRLRRIARSLTPAEQNLVLVAPTWREWLHTPRESATAHHRVVREDFTDTGYAINWLDVLHSTELERIAKEHGLRVGFLPHPNLQSILGSLDLPPHVEPLTFEGAGAQRLFASAAVLVTDYSSMAFNSAYVDRPVVYFQFDGELVRNGGHLGRAGYFDYERDGFGPVTLTVEDTVAAIGEIAARGNTLAPEYASRVEKTFVLRDGRCCERVTAEIEKLQRRAPRPVPGPVWRIGLTGTRPAKQGGVGVIAAVAPDRASAAEHADGIAQDRVPAGVVERVAVEIADLDGSVPP